MPKQSATKFDIYIRVRRTNGRKDDGAPFISPDLPVDKCRTQIEADPASATPPNVGLVSPYLDTTVDRHSRP